MTCSQWPKRPMMQPWRKPISLLLARVRFKPKRSALLPKKNTEKFFPNLSNRESGVTKAAKSRSALKRLAKNRSAKKRLAGPASQPESLGALDGHSVAYMGL